MPDSTTTNPLDLEAELDLPPGVRARRAGEGADLEADVGAGTPQEAQHA